MANLLETERLIIRSWIPERDAEQAFVIYNDLEVTHFLRKASRVTSVESQRQRLIEGIERSHQRNNGTGSWAIVEKETTTIVGTILLKQLPDKDGLPTQDYEVGWHLRRASWGKGYATEAGRVMLNYGFSVLNLPVIYAVVKPENHPSIRVTERLGMKLVGRTNKYYGIELLLFQLDALEEWKGNRGAVLNLRVGGQRSGVQRLINGVQRLVSEY
ncbi:MAG: GNAT family N-acetyltransferase [Nostoc sp.]|uniref:GNAT family N-acetyltransferase n=1 Tax=Nostoc sp. TaxID=1180 RepID=UPI002FF6637B